jgi:hypothetical protein
VARIKNITCQEESINQKDFISKGSNIDIRIDPKDNKNNKTAKSFFMGLVLNETRYFLSSDYYKIFICPGLNIFRNKKTVPQNFATLVIRISLSENVGQ